MENVKQSFKDWRQKSKRGRIPENLWKAAIDLYGKYTICEISEVLQLDSQYQIFNCGM